MINMYIVQSISKVLCNIQVKMNKIFILFSGNFGGRNILDQFFKKLNFTLDFYLISYLSGVFCINEKSRLSVTAENTVTG